VTSIAPVDGAPVGYVPRPAVGTLEVGDAELVDVAVEGIDDAAHMPSDADGS
jgi:hypothetical protein